MYQTLRLMIGEHAVMVHVCDRTRTPDDVAMNIDVLWHVGEVSRVGY